MDDDLLLTTNTLIKASDGLYQFWCTTESHDYWPATNTSLWLEWRLWCENSTGYHVTNLILPRRRTPAGLDHSAETIHSGAFLAAMIFAVHPVNVEAGPGSPRGKT